MLARVGATFSIFLAWIFIRKYLLSVVNLINKAVYENELVLH
ncbi:hypothetical protein BLGI_3485 [Brevibacillus laterosporus GI-9]|nr:hypothetical protein BLGI_3485 [Brevibacillus laterosporus GI-9]